MRRHQHGWIARCALLLLAFVAFSSLASGDTCDRMQVNFKAGQLSIQSSGCSLQQVLEAVQEKTGIQLDMPPLAATVPVTVNIEAGEPTAVLTTLLAGTNFNYIIVAGGAGNLPAQVILTDVPAAAVTTAPAVATPKADASAPAPAAVVASKEKEPVKPKKAKDKDKDTEKEGKKAEPQVAYGDDDDAQPKPELDDATLKKLPQLPAGVPAAMWRLYPDLVQNVLQNGGSIPQDAATLQGGALGLPAAGQAGQVGQPGVTTNFIDPPPLPKGVVGLPTLPPGIDPNMGKLYPWNLMQTIPGPIIYPDIKLPPMAQPIKIH